VGRGLHPETAANAADGVAIASIVAFVVAPGPTALAIAAFAWGLGSGSNWVLSSVATQRLAPAEMIGRLTSLDELFAAGAMAASACAAATLIDARVPVRTTVWLASSIAAVATLLLATHRRRAMLPA